MWSRACVWVCASIPACRVCVKRGTGFDPFECFSFFAFGLACQRWPKSLPNMSSWTLNAAGGLPHSQLLQYKTKYLFQMMFSMLSHEGIVCGCVSVYRVNTPTRARASRARARTQKHQDIRHARARSRIRQHTNTNTHKQPHDCIRRKNSPCDVGPT